MPAEPYYQPDLAWVHHVGYGHHVELTRAGILRLLQEAGLRRGARVLDVGCGSGLLVRALAEAGYDAWGTDASPAMIELARSHAPQARFEVCALPIDGRGGAGGLPSADAVVSTGHVLNYLDSREAIAAALAEMARSVQAGGLLAIDLMTEGYPAARDLRHPHCRVHEDWAIVTRFSQPDTHRFDRDITVFRRADGHWRRSDEHHRNVTFEADAALQALHAAGLDAEVRSAFGDETLPEGLVVLVGRRPSAP